jgi:fatty acid desaturase
VSVERVSDRPQEHGGSNRFLQEARSPKERRAVDQLLLAFFYVFATACIGVFFGLAWWMVVVFWFAYAALTAFVESRSVTTAGGSTCFED